MVCPSKLLIWFSASSAKRIERQIEGRRYQGDYRGHPEARAGAVFRQETKHLDMLAGQADFLFGFA